ALKATIWGCQDTIPSQFYRAGEKCSVRGLALAFGVAGARQRGGDVVQPLDGFEHRADDLVGLLFRGARSLHQLGGAQRVRNDVEARGDSGPREVLRARLDPGDRVSKRGDIERSGL